MPMCPAGHQSTASDYCDTCGAPMPGDVLSLPDAPPPGPAPVPPSARPTPEPLICPSCGATNSPDALFCEACGYDYTTGTPPRSAQPPAAPPVPADEPAPEAPDHGHQLPGLTGGVPAGERPASGADGPAPTPASEPAPTPEAESQAPLAPAAEPPAGAPDAPSGAPTSAAGAPATAAEAPAAPAAPVPATDAPAPAVQSPLEAPAAPAATGPVEWVAEVWIDPDWYATQGSSDPLPSPGLPDVVPLRRTSLLIGRLSISRNIHPDIDCELDSGVSRRHAQLSTDGPRWWIEDLDSANGTFVAPASGPLPSMPIPRGRVEVAADQRIYVGAWTRIVVRRATADEQEAFA